MVRTDNLDNTVFLAKILVQKIAHHLSSASLGVLSRNYQNFIFSSIDDILVVLRYDIKLRKKAGPGQWLPFRWRDAVPSISYTL